MNAPETEVPAFVLAEAPAAMHAHDCGCADYGNAPDGDEDLYYYGLVEAAASVLVLHGRDLVADVIARHGAPSNPAGAAQWDRDLRLAQGFISGASPS